MGHICALLLSGSDIRFLGTTGNRKRIVKNSRISGHPEPEPDIRYIPTRNAYKFIPRLVLTILLKLLDEGSRMLMGMTRTRLSNRNARPLSAVKIEHITTLTA